MIKNNGTSSSDLGTTNSVHKLVGKDQQRFQHTNQDGAGGYVRFRKSDITSLQPGQILASLPTSCYPTVVDAKGFDALAKDLCDQY